MLNSTHSQVNICGERPQSAATLTSIYHMGGVCVCGIIIIMIICLRDRVSLSVLWSSETCKQAMFFSQTKLFLWKNTKSKNILCLENY